MNVAAGRTGRQRAWRAARHVLAVRLDAMGDVLMTTPALHAIKAAHAERRLTLLTSPAGAAMTRPAGVTATTNAGSLAWK